MKAIATSSDSSFTLPACTEVATYQQEAFIPNYYAYRHDKEIHAVLLAFASTDTTKVFTKERIAELERGDLFSVEEILKLNRDINQFIERCVPHSEPLESQCRHLEQQGLNSSTAIETIRAVKTPYFQRNDANWLILYSATGTLLQTYAATAQAQAV